MRSSTLYLARTNAARSAARAFGIRQNDRFSHTYLIGRTGTGKSTLLRLTALQDIRSGRGCIVFDPHGDVVRSLKATSADLSPNPVLFLSAPKTNWHFNPLERRPGIDSDLQVAGLIEAFKKIWGDSWGPRLEHLLRNILYTLLERDYATIADIPRILVDRAYRQAITPEIRHDIVRSFWQDEYERYSSGFRSVVIAPLQNKVGALLTDHRLRSILCAEESSFDLARVMDESGVLLVDLSKGELGEGPSALLGSLLLSHIALAGLARASTAPSRRTPAFVYLDEFQTFVTPILSTMLSELRKYRVGITLANQFLGQLDPLVRDSILGNVGTLISFRVGVQDATVLARELEPTFNAYDLAGLPNYHIYLRLMISGAVSKPFSATTFASLDEIGGLPDR